MRAAGGGSMVNIASVHGYNASNKYAVYDAAKAGVINLTRQMAIDYGHDNIRVNAVCPGWILSGTRQPSPIALANAAKLYPLGRPGQPIDIAKVVRFLLSDEAAFVTGHALVADGGLTAQLQDSAAELFYR
jgi:NAD(P)-dependent dehydrogenase (short-subunit alcohol dehydrogenase family)